VAKKEGGVAKIERGVAKKWKTVAKSANLLAKKNVSYMFVSHLVPSENFLKTVKLIVQEDVWSCQVAFLQQNKSRIMDTIQDLWQLLNLLSSATCPPVELTQNSVDSDHWQHTKADGQLAFSCHKSSLYG
jgi:hypothetical protein